MKTYRTDTWSHWALVKFEALFFSERAERISGYMLVAIISAAVGGYLAWSNLQPSEEIPSSMHLNAAYSMKDIPVPVAAIPKLEAPLPVKVIRWYQDQYAWYFLTEAGQSIRVEKGGQDFFDVQVTDTRSFDFASYQKVAVHGDLGYFQPGDTLSLTFEKPEVGTKDGVGDLRTIDVQYAGIKPVAKLPERSFPEGLDGPEAN